MPDIQPFTTFAESVCQESGALINRYYEQTSLAVDWKVDESPVTQADREAELLWRDRIAARFPDHGIIAEEFGSHNEQAEWVWVIDPIDGTRSFITGVPLFATLIGLLHRGQPILGIIHQPVLDLLCLGDNTRCLLNGKPTRVREQVPLNRATLLISDATFPAIHQPEAQWNALTAQVGMMRTWGDAFGYLQVARGLADIMADPTLNPWDLLPVIPVIRGAGGIITDWQGQPAEKGTSALAASSTLHVEALACLYPHTPS